MIIKYNSIPFHVACAYIQVSCVTRVDWLIDWLIDWIID